MGDRSSVQGNTAREYGGTLGKQYGGTLRILGWREGMLGWREGMLGWREGMLGWREATQLSSIFNPFVVLLGGALGWREASVPPEVRAV